jgi:hypothetical protein
MLALFSRVRRHAKLEKMRPLFDQLLKEHRQADTGVAAAE